MSASVADSALQDTPCGNGVLPDGVVWGVFDSNTSSVGASAALVGGGFAGGTAGGSNPGGGPSVVELLEHAVDAIVISRKTRAGLFIPHTPSLFDAAIARSFMHGLGCFAVEGTCALLMAGGSGLRLWPLSRADRTKPFLRRFGSARS